MKPSDKNIHISVLFGIVMICTILPAQSISIIGSWNLSIDGSDLQAGAGSDLNPRYMSAEDQVVMDITNTNRYWTVTIQGVPFNWHSNLFLYVRRRSNGRGPGWIGGGTNWQQVSTTPQHFFQGRRRRVAIAIQYGLTGVSIQLPPDTYSGSIVYTVVEY